LRIVFVRGPFKRDLICLCAPTPPLSHHRDRFPLPAAKCGADSRSSSEVWGRRRLCGSPKMVTFSIFISRRRVSTSVATLLRHGHSTGSEENSRHSSTRGSGRLTKADSRKLQAFLRPSAFAIGPGFVPKPQGNKETSCASEADRLHGTPGVQTVKANPVAIRPFRGLWTPIDFSRVISAPALVVLAPSARLFGFVAIIRPYCLVNDCNSKNFFCPLGPNSRSSSKPANPRFLGFRRDPWRPQSVCTNLGTLCGLQSHWRRVS